MVNADISRHISSGRPSAARHDAIRWRATSAMAGTIPASRCGENGGCNSRRWRSQSSPSFNTSPFPSIISARANMGPLL
jgi:hypothetical protein